MTSEQPTRPPANEAPGPGPDIATVAVGTVGFDHAAWRTSFYDEQLPPEWRFLHYANQFRALLLPLHATREWLDGAHPELLDDSDDAFRFVFEVDQALVADDRLIPALDGFGVRVLGIVYRPAAAVGDDEYLRRLADRHAVCIDAAASPSGVSLADALGVSAVWRPAREPGPRTGPLVVTRIGTASLADMRRILDTLGGAELDGVRRGVFFDHPDCAPGQARECRILAEIMGL